MELKKVMLSFATVAGFLAAGTVSAKADTYVVKAGDTLSQIAEDKQSTVETIAQVNKIQNVNLIYVGQEFEIANQNMNDVNSAAYQATTNSYATTPAQNSTASSEVSSTTQQTSNVASSETPNSSVSSETPTQSLVTANSTSSVETTAPSSAATSETPVQTQQAKSNTQVQAPTQNQNNNVNQQSVQQANVQAQAQVQAKSVQKPSYQAPVQQRTQSTQQPKANITTGNATEEAAKAWIANKESSGNYNARNGRYIGKYQLTDSYLHGDYSPENQERVANNYVQSRYGSWAGAKAFWDANGWY